jgi:hypothetical protein
MKMTVFKRTQDQWYGSYKLEESDNGDMLVEVTFTQTGPDPDLGLGKWRVCVWGNDDCGMERDFDLEGEALHLFYHIISWTYVNKDQLKVAGFVYA